MARGAWQLEGFSGASQSLGVSRVDAALGGIPLGTWMMHFLACMAPHMPDDVRLTCKRLQVSWGEVEGLSHTCLQALEQQQQLQSALQNTNMSAVSRSTKSASRSLHVECVAAASGRQRATIRFLDCLKPVG